MSFFSTMIGPIVGINCIIIGSILILDFFSLLNLQYIGIAFVFGGAILGASGAILLTSDSDKKQISSKGK